MGVLLYLGTGENPAGADANHGKYLLIDIAFVGVLIFMIARRRKRGATVASLAQENTTVDGA